MRVSVLKLDIQAFLFHSELRKDMPDFYAANSRRALGVGNRAYWEMPDLPQSILWICHFAGG